MARAGFLARGLRVFHAQSAGGQAATVRQTAAISNSVTASLGGDTPREGRRERRDRVVTLNSPHRTRCASGVAAPGPAGRGIPSGGVLWGGPGEGRCGTVKHGQATSYRDAASPSSVEATVRSSAMPDAPDPRGSVPYACWQRDAHRSWSAGGRPEAYGRDRADPSPSWASPTAQHVGKQRARRPRRAQLAINISLRPSKICRRSPRASSCWGGTAARGIGTARAGGPRG